MSFLLLWSLRYNADERLLQNEVRKGTSIMLALTAYVVIVLKFMLKMWRYLAIFDNEKVQIPTSRPASEAVLVPDPYNFLVPD